LVIVPETAYLSPHDPPSPVSRPDDAIETPEWAGCGLKENCMGVMCGGMTDIIHNFTILLARKIYNLEQLEANMASHL